MKTQYAYRTSPNRMMVARWMRWAGNVARMWKMRNGHKICLEGLKGVDHSEDKGIDRIILK